MKQLLYIILLVVGVVCFFPEKEGRTDQQFTTCEAIMKEKYASDMQHHLEVISTDLKGSSLNIPRRNIQLPNQSFNVRHHQSVERAIRLLRLKTEEQTNKVNEQINICQTINLSTLHCRWGYHI
ncbi:MAG: hypothetical protein LUD74_03930 [Tannerellaceae bacterium]|nr:hypothetical protein [Tannerellaceae bacterium]